MDFTGKRVGIIGTGPTGVQIIQSSAPDCGQLTVFQRTANWCTPLRNRPITTEEQREVKAKADEIFALCKSMWAGFIYAPDPRTAMSVPRAERLARYQHLYGAAVSPLARQLQRLLYVAGTCRRGRRVPSKNPRARH